VCGFFIGLIFSILNFNAPGDILFYSCAVTLFFYLFVHVIAINFVDFSRFSKMIFDKKEHEEISDYFIKELDIREKRLDRMLLELERNNNNYKKIKEQNGVSGNVNGYKKAA